MNDFKENIKVDRDKKGKIIIDERRKEILIKLMKGEITKQEAMSLTGIGDKGTVEIKIQELVCLYPYLEDIYNTYISRKSSNFNGYDFKSEAIEMIRNGYSQSYMAEKLGISRRTFSGKMKLLAEENKDNILGKALKEHAMIMMQRRGITPQQLVEVNLLLDEYEEQFPVESSTFEKRNPSEVRLENYKRVLNAVERLIKEEGLRLEQIAKIGIISEGTYRKYRQEVENLEKILNNDAR